MLVDSSVHHWVEARHRRYRSRPGQIAPQNPGQRDRYNAHSGQENETLALRGTRKNNPLCFGDPGMAAMRHRGRPDILPMSVTNDETGQTGSPAARQRLSIKPEQGARTRVRAVSV